LLSMWTYSHFEDIFVESFKLKICQARRRNANRHVTIFPSPPETVLPRSGRPRHVASTKNPQTFRTSRYGRWYTNWQVISYQRRLEQYPVKSVGPRTGGSGPKCHMMSSRIRIPFPFSISCFSKFFLSAHLNVSCLVNASFKH
jgi:hypothetical protein